MRISKHDLRQPRRLHNSELNSRLNNAFDCPCFFTHGVHFYNDLFYTYIYIYIYIYKYSLIHGLYNLAQVVRGRALAECWWNSEGNQLFALLSNVPSQVVLAQACMKRKPSNDNLDNDCLVLGS